MECRQKEDENNSELLKGPAFLRSHDGRFKQNRQFTQRSPISNDKSATVY
jgi:hypothetical protein